MSGGLSRRAGSYGDVERSVCFVIPLGFVVTGGREPTALLVMCVREGGVNRHSHPLERLYRGLSLDFKGWGCLSDAQS